MGCRKIFGQPAALDPFLTFGSAREIETHAPPDFPEFTKLAGLRRQPNHKGKNFEPGL
jgi:hypothetical protein